MLSFELMLAPIIIIKPELHPPLGLRGASRLSQSPRNERQRRSSYYSSDSDSLASHIVEYAATAVCSLTVLVMERSFQWMVGNSSRGRQRASPLTEWLAFCVTIRKGRG